MGRLMLVTGGSRSGKSAYALSLADALPGPHCFVATCAPQDDEMWRRVRAHQAGRDASRWRTVEAPLQLSRAIRQEQGAGVLLVECVPLWISNLMAEAGQNGQLLDESSVVEPVEDLLAAAAEALGVVIVVTGEVGMGVVPDNAVARRYRDLLGRCNQMLAARAESATLLACGLPIQLKSKEVA